MEAERKVRQELEEINRRNEKEREMRQQKAVSSLHNAIDQNVMMGYRRRPDFGRQSCRLACRKQKSLQSERSRG